MELNNLPKLIAKSKKRVGQGIGSGKGGHTSGRGQKGQKARNKVPVYFMGAAAGASLIKRLPYLRGKGKMKSHAHRMFPLNVEFLNVLSKGTVVTVDSLIANNLVVEDTRKYGVKILGAGKLEVALTVTIPVSKQAQTKIEKAGGTVGPEKNEARKQKTEDRKPKRKQKIEDK